MNSTGPENLLQMVIFNQAQARICLGLTLLCLVNWSLPVVADETNTFLASPTVSYQYQDGGYSSPTVSYQYQDRGYSSPTVSYQYMDGIDASTTVSYLFPEDSTNDFAGYIAPGERALLSKTIILTGIPYQVVGITTSAVPQFTDLFDPATYWQPPFTLSDPNAGAEPAVIGLKANISAAFLVRYYSNGVWQICSDECTRACVYHLALAEVQSHYRANLISAKGVYSADTEHYNDDLQFRNSELLWFPTCWPKYSPIIGDSEQYKYHLAAFEHPLQDFSTYGVLTLFSDQLTPLPVDSEFKDLTEKVVGGGIDAAGVLNFTKRRFQYLPPGLAKAQQDIDYISTAWNIYSDLQDIFVVHALDTDKTSLMAHLRDKANAYQSQYGSLDPDFLAVLNKYVENNESQINQFWDNFENKFQGVIFDKLEKEAVDRVEEYMIGEVIQQGFSSAAPMTIQGVTLSASQVLGIELVLAGLTIDFVANPDGVYEQRIVAHYTAENAVNWEKIGTNYAQELDASPQIAEQDADAYLLLELMERQTYGLLSQDLVAATDASFAGGAAAGWASLLAPDKMRWLRGTAITWKYTNLHWNDVVRYMMGRTRRVPATVPDSQSPVVQIISPTSSSSYFTNQSQIVLSGTATDNVGVASISWASSAGITGSCAGTNAWQSSSIKLNPGTNTLTVSAFDAAGNVGQTVLSVIYNPLDQQPPWVVIVSPTSGSLFETGATNLTIGAQIGDDVSVSSVNWTNSRGGNGSCLISGSFALAEQIPLQAGDNPITLTAHDASGKSGADAVTVHYTPSDLTPPTVQVVFPSSETQFTVTTNIVVICGTASDVGGVVSVDWTNSLGGSGQCSGTYSWVSGLVALAEGDNPITVKAHDVSGNIGTTTILLSYLPSAPKGAIAVQFIPPNIITNGALWQFDQGYWHSGNEVVNGVSTGFHQLSFGQLVGYREMASKSIVVGPNQTSVVSVVYWNNTNLLRLDAVLKTNGLDLGLQGLAGVNYQIDVSTNLVNWVQFTNLFSTNSTTSFRDTGATNYNQRFYRAVVP